MAGVERTRAAARRCRAGRAPPVLRQLCRRADRGAAGAQRQLRSGSFGCVALLPALRELNMPSAVRSDSAAYAAALRLVGPRLEGLTGRLTDALLERQQRCSQCALRWLGLANERRNVGDEAGADGPASDVVSSGRFARWLLTSLPPRLDGVSLHGQMFASQPQFDRVFCVWASHAPLAAAGAALLAALV